MSDWKYDVDDVGEEAAAEEETLDPGSPSPEHVFFVLLGAVATVYVLFQLV